MSSGMDYSIDMDWQTDPSPDNWQSEAGVYAPMNWLQHPQLYDWQNLNPSIAALIRSTPDHLVTRLETSDYYVNFYLAVWGPAVKAWLPPPSAPIGFSFHPAASMRPIPVSTMPVMPVMPIMPIMQVLPVLPVVPFESAEPSLAPTPTLKGIPAEARLIIYEELLLAHHPVAMEKRNPRHPSRRQLYPQIIRVCKLFRKEAQHVLLTQNTFAIYYRSDVKDLKRRMSDKADKHCIKSITFPRDEILNKSRAIELKYGLKFLKNISYVIPPDYDLSRLADVRQAIETSRPTLEFGFPYLAMRAWKDATVTAICNFGGRSSSMKAYATIELLPDRTGVRATVVRVTKTRYYNAPRDHELSYEVDLDLSTIP